MIGIANAISLGMSGASGGAPAESFLWEQFSAPTVLQAIKASSGVLDASDAPIADGVRIKTVPDLSGAGYHYTQSVVANQLVWSETGGPNSKPMISMDDSLRWMQSLLITPGATTTPLYVMMVVRINTWANGKRLVGDDGGIRKIIYQDALTPNLKQYNNTATNTITPTLTAWAVIESYFSGTTGDYQILNDGTPVTGGNAGAGAADTTGRQLGWDTGSVVADIAELVYLNASPAAPERAAALAYLNTEYGL